MRNEGLEAEAKDLKEGTTALEERARYELGMVKRDEIFVQFNAGSGAARLGPGAAEGPSPPGQAAGQAAGAARGVDSLVSVRR